MKIKGVVSREEAVAVGRAIINSQASLTDKVRKIIVQPVLDPLCEVKYFNRTKTLFIPTTKDRDTVTLEYNMYEAIYQLDNIALTGLSLQGYINYFMGDEVTGVIDQEQRTLAESLLGHIDLLDSREVECGVDVDSLTGLREVLPITKSRLERLRRKLAALGLPTLTEGFSRKEAYYHLTSLHTFNRLLREENCYEG